MQTMKKILTGILLHSIISSVLCGLVLVYQRSYNTMHQNAICAASVVVQEQKAEIQILHYHLPILFPEESSLLYYAAWLMTDAPFRSWTAMYQFIKNS